MPSSHPRHAPLVRTLLDWTDSNDFPWTFPLPPWAPARSRRLRRLRILARRRVTAQRVAWAGWPRTWVQSLVWPVLALAKATRSFSQYPAPPGTGPLGHAGLVVRRWWLQVAHNFTIADMAYHFFHLPAHRSRPRSFITDREHISLMMLSDEIHRGVPDIDLKTVFARFCAQHDLPTVNAFMTGRGASVELSLPLPRTNLFLKPANSKQGRGAEILPLAPDGDAWLGADNVRLAATDLAAYAARRLGDNPWIIQERLQNASSWADFTPGALATVRIITGYIHPSGAPECIAAYLRCPRTGSMVDNMCAGGFGASLDLATGELGPGRDWINVHAVYDRHPDTGMPIKGRILPGWDQIQQLALRAHACAGGWLTLGWDIPLTTRGPIIVEANVGWALMPFGPAEDTRYLEIFESRLLR